MDSMLYESGEFLSDSDEGNSENIDQLDLQPCPICDRTFLPPALAKHVGICEKMNFKKRKPFDSFRQRREGTELATYLPSDYALPKNWPASSSTSFSKSNTFTAGVTKQRPLLSQVNFDRKTHERTKQSPQPSSSTTAKPTKRTHLAPVSERCPHCDRCFGIKAYDRHVEWCKEKSRLKNPNASNELNLAKGRLEARTKYKAPNLKSKREKNREKYSGMSDSFTSLTESWLSDPYKKERKNSMSVSLTSSITSDGKCSDKYDPFLSAKRQFEDLFSPSYKMTTSTPAKSAATTPSTKSNTLASIVVSPTSTSTSTKSNFRRTSSLRAPKRSPASSIYSTTKYKPTIQRGISDEGPISSNFMKPEEYDELPVKSHAIITPDLVPRSPSSRDLVRRSSSREIGRRSLSRSSTASRSPSRDLPANASPTTAAASIPVVIRRDSRASAKRRQLHLDIKCPNAPEYPLTKTDSLAAFLMYENDLSCSPDQERDVLHATNAHDAEKDFHPAVQVNKLDHDQSLTVIEENEKNNSDRIAESQMIRHHLLLDTGDHTHEYSRSLQTPEGQPDILLSPKYHNHKLTPIVRPVRSAQSTKQPLFDEPNLLEHSRIDESTAHNIDPKLININDNLKMSVSRQLSDIASIDSSESNQTTKLAVTVKSPSFDFENMANQYVTLQRINSAGSTISDITGLEKRSLKRQLKLNKDNFLYDSLADPALRDEFDGRTVNKAPTILPPLQPIANPMFEPSESNGQKKDRSTANIESLFDDFDIEEFISSFEDDDQYPIFKNYKELISNSRSGIIKQYGSDGSSDSESIYEEKSNEHNAEHNDNVEVLEQCSSRKTSDVQSQTIGLLDGKDVINKLCRDAPVKDSIRLTPPESDRPSGIPKKISLPLADENMSQAEKELLNSVHELNQMCETNNSFQMDSNDDLSTADNYPFSRSVSSKHSADSAYSSLCRQSPIEKAYNPLHRVSNRNQPRMHQPFSYQIPEIIGGCTPKSGSETAQNSPKSTIDSQSIPIRQSLSSARLDLIKGRGLSSSCSDSSLPPILATAITTHKNDSQNIYNAINENSVFDVTPRKQERSAISVAHKIDINNLNSNCNNNDNSNDKHRNSFDSRMPKFCYECGAKYIVPHAKFCMECGVKRVSLDQNSNK